MEVKERSVPADRGNRPGPPATSGTKPRWTVAALVLAAIVGFYALGLYRYLSWDYLRSHLDDLREKVQAHLLLAVVVLFLTYTLVTALSLPVAAPLTIVSGALFGRWVGTGVVAVAATIGATLAFLSSRYVLRDAVQRRFQDRLATLNRGIDRDGAFYLFSLRLVPAVPFFLINLGMGLTPIPIATFLWVSFVGMLPGTFVYVNAGTALGSLESPKDILSPGVLVSFVLLGLLPLALRKLVRPLPPSPPGGRS